MTPATHRVVIACFCAAALAAVGCADGSGVPTSPSASAAVSNLATTSSAIASSGSPRSGDLHVTKDCPRTDYQGRAGDFCTIASSNVDAIEVGSRIVYAQAADFATHTLDSDVVLNPPEPGNNLAFGHCHFDLATGLGLCTFSGGTGKFTQLNASANVSHREGTIYAWDGTYSFSPRE
jgi:hypothetical protein